jgi:hypothetical protein
LTVTIQTRQFAATRPLDKFAKQFVQFLDDRFYVQYGVSADSHRYLQSIKVLDCSNRFWEWLLNARDSKMSEGSPFEYDTPQTRESITGLSMPAIGKHRTTNQHFWMPKDTRASWLSNIFPSAIAHALAPYDALIFLYRTDRWATKLTHAIDPSVRNEEFKLAKRLTVATAPYLVTAHESLHLVLRLVGGEMPTWNPSNTPDPVDDIFFEYLDQITLPTFARLYLHYDEPQADRIDL